MLPIEIAYFAHADLAEAICYLNAEQAGLGAALHAEFHSALEGIQLAPLSHRRLLRNARRTLLPQFKYHVYYQVLPHTIRIVAVVHAHRNPRFWKKLLRQRS
ncbi:MAG TPA: hypothetical protein VGP72_04845 [Planctomycetota bacterium]|jgi:plasmid stabilization system protein ParE